MGREFAVMSYKGKATGLQVAIVGAGLMGQWHAYYAARAGATVAAIVDPNHATVTRLGARHPQAQRFATLDACLARRPLDAVHLCTPAASHVALATAALAAGIPVLLEKPVAPTLADTARLLDLAERAGVLLAPVHQLPFQRGVRTVRQRRPRLGDLVHLGYVTCSAGGAGQSASARRELLLEIAPHPLSLFRALLDAEASDIAWRTTTHTADDLAFQGQLGNTTLSALLSLRGRPTRNSLTAIGTHGAAHVDLFHGYAVLETGEPSRRTKIAQPFIYGGKLLATAGINLARRALIAEPAYPGLPELIAQFYDAVMRRGACPIAAAEIRDIAVVVDRLRLGAAAGGT